MLTFQSNKVSISDGILYIFYCVNNLHKFFQGIILRGVGCIIQFPSLRRCFVKVVFPAPLPLATSILNEFWNWKFICKGIFWVNNRNLNDLLSYRMEFYCAVCAMEFDTQHDFEMYQEVCQTYHTVERRWRLILL